MPIDRSSTQSPLVVETLSPGDELWRPAEADAAATRLADFTRWTAARERRAFSSYLDLWRWSTEAPEAFWRGIWDFFAVAGEGPGEVALTTRTMPGARWFPQARLNYAEHLMRHASVERPALVVLAEDEPDREVSWAELERQAGALAASLRRLGVERGDRVVAYLPNGEEAVVGLVACASLGAVWASCAPDFGTTGVQSRLAQLRPKVLLGVDGYRFGGREFDRRAELERLAAELPGLEHLIEVRARRPEAPLVSAERVAVHAWETLTAGDEPLVCERLPFEHPLWILFSSGTTGTPKGIVQSHGGILLEHLKVHGLQADLGPEDRFLFVGTTSWMVWNLLVGGLLLGATVVLLDGNPGHPGPERLWELVARTRVTQLGVGAGFLQACAKAGLDPTDGRDLSALRSLTSTGSPLSLDGYAWAYEHLGPDLWLSSSSGGTDVCTAFVGAAPTLPVRAGRIQAPALGVAVAAWDGEGHPVTGATGELVITTPMPSMPIGFWDDADGERYRRAYFERWPGVWRHGDLVSFEADGSCVIHGRSDATLNRNGVRMGSAELYAVVEGLPQVREALVLGIEGSDGSYAMPLYVVPAEGVELDDELRGAIRLAIREGLSPRHVPDAVRAAPGVPHTRTGKKLEVPVKRLFQGVALGDAVDLASVDDAALVRFFAREAALHPVR